jgi:hypothetical protein
VADAPLSSLTVNNPHATEGIDTSGITVATFTDANTDAPTTHFTAVIDWGDGTTSTVTGSGIVSLGGGSFAVKASHTYAEETSSPITLSVQVLDDGGSSVSASQTLSVADAALASLRIAAVGPTEGISLGTVTVATFHDADTASPVTDFTAVINWGDGSTTTVTGSGIVALGGGNFAVRASHTYAEETSSPLTLEVQVLDHGGSSVSGSHTIAVADAALSSLVLSPLQPTEGKGIGLIRVASFHDANLAAPATDFTATLTWGDGTTTLSGSAGNIVALGGGNFALLANHTYAEEGNHTLSVQVKDTDGASISGSRGLSVADARLSSLGVVSLRATEGRGTGTVTVATFTDANAAAPSSDFTAVVRWGDGGTTTVSGSGIVSLVGGKFAVLAGHTYAEEGSVTLSVQVLDVGGASVSGGRTISVADARLTNLRVQNPHATHGVDTGTFTVATFHDNNLQAPTTDFTAVIHWGDGTTSTLLASDFVSQGNGNFAVLADHLFAAAGTVTLSVLVEDVGGASISGTLEIAVS